MWPNHLNATFQLEDRTIKTRSAKKPRAERVQYGALPYRRAGEADMQVLLVTSRGTKRWIIPKGWPIKGLKPAEAAAREAYEEAGVRGRVGRPLGNYVYDKFSENRQASMPCEVKVYPLAVKRQLKQWPESKQRQVQWYTAEEAAALVGDAGLRELILRLNAPKDSPPRK